MHSLIAPGQVFKRLRRPETPSLKTGKQIKAPLLGSTFKKAK
jgi:hypothetical protein